MQRPILLLAFCSILHGVLDAQEPAALEFTGSPLNIPYACADEDLDWAGLSCQDSPCPIYVELSTAAGFGKTIIVAGDFHVAAATMYSLLLRSDDGGRTWREPFGRARGVVLDRIQMYDPLTAWISGQTAQPLNLDPFFLVTNNGGVSWQRVPIYEEGTPGAILQFAFDSKDHGVALVDRGGGPLRYELYETESSGTSWTIRQKTDQIPKIKPAPEADWRLRAEPKLYRLEHLEDGRWGPFAAFATNAAQCRQQPAAERSEPPPPTTDAAPATGDAAQEIHLKPPPKAKPQP